MKAFRLVNVVTHIPLAPLPQPLFVSKRYLSSSSSAHKHQIPPSTNNQAEILSNNAKKFALQGHYASMVSIMIIYINIVHY